MSIPSASSLRKRMENPEILIAIERGFPSTIHTNVPIASIHIPYVLPKWAVYVLLYHVVSPMR